MNRRLGMATEAIAGCVGVDRHGEGMTEPPAFRAPLSRGQLGALGEQLAVDYLTGLGLQVIERNWRCRYGELDVIAADPAARAVVFVEVKTRTTDLFGGVAEAVTPQKVRRIRRLAALWLAGQADRWAHVRIDVVGVRIGRCRTPELTHVQGVG
jgi:putative endonuclease